MLPATSSSLKHHRLSVCPCPGIKSFFSYLTRLAIKQRTHAAHERLNRARPPMPDTTMITTLLLLLFLALPVLPARASSPPPLQLQSLHLELARVDALPSSNLTDQELLRRAVQRSLERVAGADGRKVAAEAPLVQGGGEYLVKLGIGTPQHFVSAAIDTASDLVWVQCQPCVSCYRQSDPIFNPKLSSSFAAVPCGSDTCAQIDEHRYIRIITSQFIHT